MKILITGSGTLIGNNIANYLLKKGHFIFASYNKSKPENLINFKKCKLINIDHHLCHVASAVFDSNYEKSVNLSIDGFGDFASLTWGISEKNNIKIDDRVLFPHSLGIFYEAFTQFLGFKNYGDEYKVMGLSSLGKPTELNKMQKIISLKKMVNFY